MKKFLKFFAAITVLSIISFAGLAQPSPGGNPGGGNVGGPPIGGSGGGSAPVGGGIVLLLTMAAGYGLKKVFDARNKFQG